jgi:hypothetical protein
MGLGLKRRWLLSYGTKKTKQDWHVVCWGCLLFGLKYAKFCFMGLKMSEEMQNAVGFCWVWVRTRLVCIHGTQKYPEGHHVAGSLGGLD